MQKHPKVGNHVNKEFKEFERLQGIFGKDRANGQRAETAADAVENGENQADDDDWTQQHDNSPSSGGNTSTRNEHASAEPPPKRQRLAQIASTFIESFNSKMDAVTTDFAKVADKIPDPSKRDLVQEVKKLELTEEEEIELIIKFSQNPQFEKFFWEFQGTQRMSFARRIMRMH